MTSYQITSSAGMDMGTFEGETPEEAIEAMDRDAGYTSSAHAAEVLGTTVEAMRAGLTVREVAAEAAETPETFDLEVGSLRDRYLTAARVLELVESADPFAEVEVRDQAGVVCEIAADLDMECLVLRRGEEIIAIGEEVSEEVLDRWCDA